MRLTANGTNVHVRFSPNGTNVYARLPANGTDVLVRLTANGTNVIVRFYRRYCYLYCLILQGTSLHKKEGIGIGSTNANTRAPYAT